MSQKLDGVRPILCFHLVHVLLLSPVVFFKVDGKEPILRDITSSSTLVKDGYGVENDLGSRCKRHQKHSKTCSCLFGVMVQSGYFVGKMSMIQCGQLWAMRNYTNSCTVSKTAKPGGSSTSLWSQNPHSFGWENTLVSISGGSGIRPSCSSCLIKPKSNGYKRDVVNTSIEFHLFEVINSYYSLCNLFSSYGGL